MEKCRRSSGSQPAPVLEAELLQIKKWRYPWFLSPQVKMKPFQNSTNRE
jgi:hypothetical protein